jgi:hypothetical protein
VQSQRIIPVIPAVLDALREAIDSGPRDVRGLIFVTSQANPWKPSSWTKVTRKEIDTIHRATGNPAFDGYQFHWLRATFLSAVRSQGVDDRLVKRYIGHSIGDTMAKHLRTPPPRALRTGRSGY